MEELKLFQVEDGGGQDWVAARNAREAALLSLTRGLLQEMDDDELTVTRLLEKDAGDVPFYEDLAAQTGLTDLWTFFVEERKPAQLGAEPAAKILGSSEA